MKNLTRMFEDLRQQNASQTIQGEAGRRLKDVVDEVERMKRGMEDKLRQIQGTPPRPPRQCGSNVAAEPTSLLCSRTGGQDPEPHPAQRGESGRRVRAGGRGGEAPEGHFQTCRGVLWMHVLSAAVPASVGTFQTDGVGFWGLWRRWKTRTFSINLRPVSYCR